MKKRLILWAIGALVLSAIPAGLSCLAASTYVFDCLVGQNILSQNAPIKTIQEFCLWIGAVPAALLCSYQIFVSKLNADKAAEERDLLIQMNKKILRRRVGRNSSYESA